MGSESFSWVVDGVIGGMSQPGVIMPVTDDLVQLRKNYGIGVVVSLTEDGLDAATVERAGLSYVHLPVVDFTRPSQDALDRVVELASQAKLTGNAVAVHCAAGVGRTGTALAAVMVSLAGMPAGDAVTFVRKARPGSIEAPEQEQAVHDHALRLDGASGGSVESQRTIGDQRYGRHGGSRGSWTWSSESSGEPVRGSSWPRSGPRSGSATSGDSRM